jgi:hypothetical protein
LEDLPLRLGAATRSPAPLFIAAPEQSDNAGPNEQETKQPALKRVQLPRFPSATANRRDSTGLDGADGRTPGRERATSVARAAMQARTDAAGEHAPRDSVITKAAASHSRQASETRPNQKAPEPRRRRRAPPVYAS